MKSRIASNLKPLLSAFYPFLFAIAALWAMPRNAQAQLYVTSDVVGKYNATTGEVINASFITGPVAFGLAVKGKIEYRKLRKVIPNSQLYALWRAVPKVET